MFLFSNIRVKGYWKYYYRAVDKNGENIDFLLTGRRDKKTALRFLTKAIGCNGKPRLIKRITKPMLGFKSLFCAQRTLAGVGLIQMIKKCQIRNQAGASKTPAELFYGLAI